MVQMQNTPIHSAEIFQIIEENLPPLFAYQLVTRGSAQQVRTGRKLADRLMRTFAGHWVWTDEVIVTDGSQDAVAIEQALQTIRSNEKDVFKDLVGIKLLENWQPSPIAIAEFVAHGLFSDLSSAIQAALLPIIDLDGRATVEREAEIRGWVVKGKPAISISIESRVIFRDDLKSYFRQLQSPDELIGMFVVDKVRYDTGHPMKGEIVGYDGQLDIEVSRQELLDIAKREGSRHIIEKAERGEYVVRVGNGEHRYVLSALRIIVFPKHYRRFKIDTRKAQNATWIKPPDRASLVKRIADIARSHGLIETPLASKQPGLFSIAAEFHYDPRIMLGKKAGQHEVMQYIGDNALFTAINKYGLYRPSSDAGTVGKPLNIGIMNASSANFDLAQDALRQQLQRLGFTHINMVEERADGVSRIDFERAINRLRSAAPHVVLGIIPNSDSLDQDDWGPYYDFKWLMMERETPNQVIDQNTLSNTKNLPYVMINVAFGMSAKMGNVPYILANSLDYADIVVGIDIARRRNKSGVGTQNAAAIAQIYHKGGQFARCRVVGTPLEGETVPANVLRNLFPLAEFEGKRVIIHRDGPFRGDEVQIIRDHLAKLEATAFFVEVIKSGAPRLYTSFQGQVIAPNIGLALRLSDTEAFLVTSQSSTATPQPLQVRTQAPFTIGKALHSVLMLTLVHYGSVKRPKLPVTIHYSDRIGYLALRGVKPAGGQSTDMYWL